MGEQLFMSPPFPFSPRLLGFPKSGVQLGGRLPLPLFENRRKFPDFGKKGSNCVHPWVESSIQNVVLRVSRRKNSKVYRSALIPKNLPCPEKYLVTRL